MLLNVFWLRGFMLKVVFVSKNYQLIEEITAYINGREDLAFVLFSTTRPKMVLEEIEAFEANIVLMDVMSIEESEIVNMCLKITESSHKYQCMILTTKEFISSWIYELEHVKMIDGSEPLKDNLDEVFMRIVEHY